ncbi:MAG: NAD(P)/FAD-dependent oxidoreductase, partial [Actinomycetota bacterium]|nr:NAD(P)/FAD-dependent oxidoreductase [Actinomycetota bacterium]
VGGFCVPNAQHAVRQGKRLAKNIAATLRDELPQDYRHENLGAVAGLGPGHGAFQSGKIGLTGPIAWLMHRGYHGLAIPTWERKIRVIANWVLGFVLGRDITPIENLDNPRAFFEQFASRPKPAAQESPRPVEASQDKLPGGDGLTAPVYATPSKGT